MRRNACEDWRVASVGDDVSLHMGRYARSPAPNGETVASSSSAGASSSSGGDALSFAALRAGFADLKKASAPCHPKKLEVAGTATRSEVDLVALPQIDDSDDDPASESDTDMMYLNGQICLESEAQAARKMSKPKPRPVPAPVSVPLSSVASGSGAAPDAVAPPPPVPDADLDGVPRERRFESFGRFKVAPVFSHGELYGYGATCGLHTDPSDKKGTQCKVQLPLGKRSPLSPEEARRRVKFWCVLGLKRHAEIQKDDKPRSKHLSMKPRSLEVTMSEREMDDFVASLG